jgi:hypothetical protein
MLQGSWAAEVREQGRVDVETAICRGFEDASWD